MKLCRQKALTCWSSALANLCIGSAISCSGWFCCIFYSWLQAEGSDLLDQKIDKIAPICNAEEAVRYPGYKIGTYAMLKNNGHPDSEYKVGTYMQC